MKINLGKYSKLKTYKSSGKDCYYDKVSKELRIETEKERTRLGFVEFLHEKMGIPYEAMETDVSISDYDSEESGQIDIGIFAHDKDKFDIITLAVKCLKKGSPLTDEVFEEICNYADIAEAPFVAMTNGEELEIYYYNEKVDKYEDVEEIPSYDELCEQLELEKYPNKFKAYKKASDKFSSKEEAYRYFLEKTDTLGKDTAEKYYLLIIKLEDLLMNYSNELNIQEVDGYKIDDLGIRYSSFGDTDSENCVGNYRSFRVESKQFNTRIVSMGLFAFIKTAPNLKSNNLLEKTYLNIVVDNFRENYQSLQLPIDELVSFSSNEAVFIVSGVDSKGENKKDILGKLSLDKELTINDNSVQELLSNLVKYALLLAKDNY